MLIWMREGAGSGIVKFLLMGLLLLAGAGLVLMDVGGFFKGNLAPGTVIKGGGVNISANEFNRIVDRALRSVQMGPQEAYQMGLINEIAASEIQNRLLANKAEDMGFVVSDEALARQISKLAEPLETQGRSKKEAIQQILRNQGISEEEFLGAVRSEMGNNLVRMAIMPPDTLASPLLARALYRYDHETRDVKAVVLDNKSATLPALPDDKTLEDYYTANKMLYAVPETRTITLATLKPEMMAKNATVSDEDVLADYNRNAASYTKPVQRRIEQALLKTQEDAQTLLDALKSGKTMKESLDESSYLGIENFAQAGLLPEIAGPVFDAQKGDVIGPIETALGFHVLVLKDILPEQKVPFEDVKNQIRKDLEHTAQINAMFETSTTIEDRIAAGDPLDDLVKEYGMTTEKIGPFGANGYDSQGGDAFKPYGADRTKLIEGAFELNEGEVSPIIETADGQFRLVQVDQITPETHKPFADVKEDVKKRWTAEQQRALTQEKAKQIAESLKTGKSLEDVAKENGLSIKTMTAITRLENPPAPLNPIVGAQIFNTALNTSFSGQTEGGFIVGIVTNITLPDEKAPKEKDMADLKTLTARALPQDTMEAFSESLKDGKTIQINQRFIDQTYGGQAEPASGP